MTNEQQCPNCAQVFETIVITQGGAIVEVGKCLACDYDYKEEL